MLARCGTGFGLLGLASLLGERSPGGDTARAAGASVLPLAPRPPHHAPRARRMVHSFMNGGPSQVDTFDPKPALDRYHGQPLPLNNFRTGRKTGAAMRSPFAFRPRGQSGIAVSELFDRTAAHIDDMAVIRSMQAEVPNHEPSLMLMISSGSSTRSTRPRGATPPWRRGAPRLIWPSECRARRPTCSTSARSPPRSARPTGAERRGGNC